jgi:hypothetical protein
MEQTVVYTSVFLHSSVSDPNDASNVNYPKTFYEVQVYPNTLD